MRDQLQPHVAALAGSPSTPITTDPTVRVSVLIVGQRSLAADQRGRFVAGSGAHHAQTAPDLAGALIRDHTRPSDPVSDPLAGIGTTLTQAVHTGRNGFGVENEPGWAALARATVGLARHQDALNSPCQNWHRWHGSRAYLTWRLPHGYRIDGKLWRSDQPCGQEPVSR